MDEVNSILHELYVYSEWKPEPEFLQKPDGILSENLLVFWRWLRLFGPRKGLIDSVNAFKEKQLRWHIALGDEGKVIAVLTDCILEIRTKRSEYATIAARTTVSRDAYPQWRKLAWSPDCSFIAVAYGAGVITFYDLTASSLFNIPIECSRPSGMECSDTTHAVVEMIFTPLRVKDSKWNWEVLVITHDGKLRSYLVSQTEGFQLHHSFRFDGGVSAIVYSESHNLLYVAGMPRIASKDPDSPLHTGITAWRILNDDPFYKLSVVSDQLDMLGHERFQFYLPFISTKNLAFIVKMCVSNEGNKLVCLHCNGDITVWTLPLLKLLHRWPLAQQPHYDLDSPLQKEIANKDTTMYYPADVSWWSDKEIILSRFTGAIKICNIENMINILGKKPEFLQGTPQVTGAHDGTFLALECETSILPGKRRNDDDETMVIVEEEKKERLLDVAMEVVKRSLYALTDLEMFQPPARRIALLARVYRLMAVRSTTPQDLFHRKIEGGKYSEALALSEMYELDSDRVYQQQWRKANVSDETITLYLSKVRKKIWAVHQCVDRLPESLLAAKQLLSFGLQLTNEEIMKEVNKDRSTPKEKVEDIVLEDLNTYSSELLRCRHVMLFYKERLHLYEEMLKTEKSTYSKEEYHRLRSNSLVYSAIEIAKEGRLDALVRLWPHIKQLQMKLNILNNIPETINPCSYRQLLPSIYEEEWMEMPVEIILPEADWCKNEIFRSIWSSNWSEDVTPENELPAEADKKNVMLAWYEQRAKQIVECSGMVSHALTLLTLGSECGFTFPALLHDLKTLDTLIYDLNIEGVSLSSLQAMHTTAVSMLIMSLSDPNSYIRDLREYLFPYLTMNEQVTGQDKFQALLDFLDEMCKDSLMPVLVLLQSSDLFNLSIEERVTIAERAMNTSITAEDLADACDILDTLLQQISRGEGGGNTEEMVKRVRSLEVLVVACGTLTSRGVSINPRELSERTDREPAMRLLATVAAYYKTAQETHWHDLLDDLLKLQMTVFHTVSKMDCYEIYCAALLSSGDPSVIGKAEAVLWKQDARPQEPRVARQRSVLLVLAAAQDYIDQATTLTDANVKLASCCLSFADQMDERVKTQVALISAFPVLSSFGLNALPSQVVLCKNRMDLVEKCLQSDKTAYQSTYKLMALAKALNVAGDDEDRREALVYLAVGRYSLCAGSVWCASAAATALEAARRRADIRLAADRADGAAPFLAMTANHPHTRPLADANLRRRLLSAALYCCKPTEIEEYVRDRVMIEMERLQQDLSEQAKILQEEQKLEEKYESFDDEFSDAITTPTLENKEINNERSNFPFFNYIYDYWQKEPKKSLLRPYRRKVEKIFRCHEFYRTVYPYMEPAADDAAYEYARFSRAPAHLHARGDDTARMMFRWFYNRSTLGDNALRSCEYIVASKCGSECMYSDTAVALSCLTKSAASAEQLSRFLESQSSEKGIGLALYSLLLKAQLSTSTALMDDVFLMLPKQLALRTLSQSPPVGSSLVGSCVSRLSRLSQHSRLQALGYDVNGLRFDADPEYRSEILDIMARSGDKDHMGVACLLATKYGMDVTPLWVKHAAYLICNEHSLPHDEIVEKLNDDNMIEAFKADREAALASLQRSIWDLLNGGRHYAMLYYFTLISAVDEKWLLHGMTAKEHLQQLKRVKSISLAFDYKILFQELPEETLLTKVVGSLTPETIGLFIKLFRTLPPSIDIKISVNLVYLVWLSQYFYQVPQNTSNKRWMQQYRVCASYYNKLNAQDFLDFISCICFSERTVDKVPLKTRYLILNHALEYCNQEHINRLKTNDKDTVWAETGDAVKRWKEFLDSYHSENTQNLIKSLGIKNEFLYDVEASQGVVSKLGLALGTILMESELPPDHFSAIVAALQVDVQPSDMFLSIVDEYIDSLRELELAVQWVDVYHKSGAAISEQCVRAALRHAASLHLPTHKRVALLALMQNDKINDNADLTEVIQFTIDLLKNEWPNYDYCNQLTVDFLRSPEDRRKAFRNFLAMADNWERKKALVDVLLCWPPDEHTKDTKSLHSEYLCTLLSNVAEPKESLVLIKLLLKKPVLNNEELEWVVSGVQEGAVINALWVILLSGCGDLRFEVLAFIARFEKKFETVDLEEDLIKELLDKDLFLYLVKSPLFRFIINYILSGTCNSTFDPTPNKYTIEWATHQLLTHNFIAEAGNLHLIGVGVPRALRSFSTSIMYSKGLLRRK